MHCPRDKRELTSKKENGISYHVCESCHGILLLKTDLDQLNLEQIKLESPSTRRSHINFVEGAAVSPSANEKMEVIHYHGVKIDICRETGNVWLDGGELELIIKSMRARKRKKMAGELGGPVADSMSDTAVEIAGEFAIDAVVEIIAGIFDS